MVISPQIIARAKIAAGVLTQMLVTNKNETLVEYATAGMDNKLFVSKYLAVLPDKKQLERLVAEELRKL